MKAQATFEFLLNILIFISVLAILFTPIIRHFTEANHTIQNSKITQSLNIISTNLAFLYLSTNTLSIENSPQNLRVYLQKNIIKSNNSYSYTLNPAKGAAYGQNEELTPQ